MSLSYSLFLPVLLTLGAILSVDQSFKQSKLVPDIIKSSPEAELFLFFGTNKVDLGNRLTPTQVKSVPLISWLGSERSYYALTFSDPDATSSANATSREFLHWLVGNIPGTDLNRADTLAEFIGSAPPKGSGDHRYVALVYKQPGKIDFKMDKIAANNTAPRRNFSAQKFAEKYGFDPIPVAGNFYIAAAEA